MRTLTDVEEQSSHGFCPICSSEGKKKSGDFIICMLAHAYTQEEALLKPRLQSFLALEAMKVPEAPYGFCPMCNAKGIARDPRYGGYDHCANGHGYNSASARSKQMGNYCPTLDCDSIRVYSDHRVDGIGACGHGHVHKSAAFIEQEIR